MNSLSPARGTTVALRKRILSDPKLVLDDPEIMEALASAQTSEQGKNIVDMRSLAMNRMEERLDHLEEAHQTVIAAAYDGVSVTRQVHRAILTMIAPLEFKDFLNGMNKEVADCLRAKAIRLVLETQADDTLGPLSEQCDVISLVGPGYTTAYRGGGRKSRPAAAMLRTVPEGALEVYRSAASDIRSEAILAIDLGTDRLPGMLVIGSTNADQYRTGDATDLLEVFGALFERVLRSWL
ncbi:MAG: DUF484 family protein [Pseudomonadota bacterium]